MSWLRGMSSAALSTAAKAVFSPRPNLPFRMLSNIAHSPIILDKSREDPVMAKFNASIQETIDRTAGTAQQKPQTPDERWAQQSQNSTFHAPADPFTGRYHQ
ncbi:hypothetical protein M405DRAFT_519077 [Rhizopogon salebrosus TDB-379]|nr:hypothetical protein M405DRAFT_519077 [Rhizopogon salebrosus TDB-379]